MKTLITKIKSNTSLKLGLMLILLWLSVPFHASDIADQANKQQIIFYIPWILVLLGLFILIPIFFKVSSLNKKKKLTNTINDQWRSILTLPTFIGGIGISLTFFSLIFAFTNYGDKTLIPVLLPLAGLSIIFVIFAKNSYSLLK